MAYEVRVDEKLHAAHAIRTPAGDLEPLHWHAWGIEVVFEGPELDEAGVLVDFLIVQRRLREVLGPLEGTNLNDHPPFSETSSSAEHVARHVHEALAGRDWGAARLVKVIVREAPGCVAAYWAPKTDAADPQ